MSNDASEWLIYIVGSRSMQCELLAAFLEKETGLPCRVGEGIDRLPRKLAANRQSIIFSDCQGRSAKGILRRLKGNKCYENDDAHIVLFNVSSGLNIEEEFLSLGIWGVFYEEDPPENLVRGVEAIKNGEIWLSRQVMSSCLVNMRRREGGLRQERFVLSIREREVLLLVADGLSNDEIADKLCLSVHTARSHVYRIFKKIEVTNRQQAAQWAIRYL
jgi:LuxR family transcriptional regulator of csgAB operon